jgi:hypothetical protein
VLAWGQGEGGCVCVVCELVVTAVAAVVVAALQQGRQRDVAGARVREGSNPLSFVCPFVTGDGRRAVHGRCSFRRSRPH